jgi:hypothetical protein
VDVLCRRTWKVASGVAAVMLREREKRRRLWCKVLRLGGANLEHGGQIYCMGQARRKAGKHVVKDIDDSIKEKPAVNSVTFTFREVSAR